MDSSLHTASWSKRFFAHVIDFVAVLIIFGAMSIPLSSILVPIYEMSMDEYAIWDNVNMLILSLAFFTYWTVLEYAAQTTIGKKLLGLKVVKMDGTKPELRDTAISSFGKAFLLPVDVVLGWLFTNSKRQRIFSKLAGTIVIDPEENVKTIIE